VDLDKIGGGKLPDVEMDCVPHYEEQIDFEGNRYIVHKVVYSPLEGTAHLYITGFKYTV
jgi:hypothetical protein